MRLKPLVLIALAGGLASVVYFLGVEKEAAEPGPTLADESVATPTVAQDAEMSITIDASIIEQAEKRERLADLGVDVAKTSYPIDNQEWRDQTFVLPKVIATDDGRCVAIEMPIGESRCWEEFGFEPYMQYDLQVLEGLASNDAKASAVLAMSYRYVDEKKSLFYALQASKLSSKSGPLVRYVQNADAHGDTEKLLDLYAIALYAENVGFELPLSGQFRYWIANQGLSEAEIDELMNDRTIVATLEVTP